MDAAGKLARRTALALGLSAALLAAGSSAWLRRPLPVAMAEDAVTDPYLGQPDAIAEGDDIYHSKCIICHGLKCGRGPNLFASRLSDEEFLEVVINGRKGTLMPAWGFRLSPDDVWKVHAFLKAHPNGLSL